MQRILTEGMNSLHSFERWSKHIEMKQYSSVLEEWDDQIGEDNEALDSNFLNPEEWIDQEMKNNNINKIRNLFEIAFNKANDYLSKFNKYLQIYWEYNNIDYSIFTHPDLARPAITLNCTLNVLDYHKSYFDGRVPHQADIGLLRIESKKIKEKICPVPMQTYKRVAELIAPENKIRNSALEEWISKSISELRTVTTDIDMFVEQTKALKKIEKDLPIYKERLKTIGELYDILRMHHIEVKKDEAIAFTGVKNLELQLGAEIIKTNENISKNQEIFSKDIKNNLIPQLEKDVLNLESLVMNQKYLTPSTDLVEAIKELEIHWET